MEIQGRLSAFTPKKWELILCQRFQSKRGHIQDNLAVKGKERERNMNTPITVVADTYSKAWAMAIYMLKDYSWDVFDLVVTIKNPETSDDLAFGQLTDFAKTNDLILPKQVAHTIFPEQSYRNSRVRNREQLYQHYNRFYVRSRHMKHSNWGTYFKRMISYKTPDGDVDQLGKIIDHINSRETVFKASEHIVIPQPASDGNRKMGGPCLNYIAVQQEKNAEGNRQISLLAVYRNHDFYERAFGNYLGLCNLLKYICEQTGSIPGFITCISSHAYVLKKRALLLNIAESIIGGRDE